MCNKKCQEVHTVLLQGYSYTWSSSPECWEIQNSFLVCLSSPDRDVLLSSLTERPHQRPGLCSDSPPLHRDDEASPFTFSWNDLTSTFLLASAFIHIWGSQWTSFNNSPHVDACYDPGLTHGRNTQWLIFSHSGSSRNKCTDLNINAQFGCCSVGLFHEDMSVGQFLVKSAFRSPLFANNVNCAESEMIYEIIYLCNSAFI